MQRYLLRKTQHCKSNYL